MGLVLMAALSISLSSIKERKAAMGLNKSSQAFQRAASGVEIVFKMIKDNPYGKVGDIDEIAGVCDGIIEDTARGFKVELKNEAEEVITNCNIDIADIKLVKSIGTMDQNQRSVEAAVAEAPVVLSGNDSEMTLPNGSFTVLCWGTYSTCENYSTNLLFDGSVVKTFPDVGGDQDGCDQNTVMVKLTGINGGDHNWTLLRGGNQDFLWIVYPE